MRTVGNSPGRAAAFALIFEIPRTSAHSSTEIVKAFGLVWQCVVPLRIREIYVKLELVPNTDSVKNRKDVNQLVRYQWVKATGGYEWISVKVPVPPLIEGGKRIRFKPESDFLLVESDRAAGRRDIHAYEAPDNLFDIFAKTSETKEGIKAFADEYGELGFEIGKGAERFPDDAVSGSNFPGELLSSWRQAIASMRSATELWQAIAEARNYGDESALSRYVKWDLARGRVSVSNRDPTHWRGGASERSWLGRDDARRAFGAFRRGELIRPAQEFLREELLGRLAGSLSVLVDWADWNTANSKLVRSLRPNSLLALLWLQFADALTGAIEFRLCKRKGCGKLIQISREPGGSRTNRQTCSDSCKVRLYQERVRTVIKSFDQGKAPEEIAKSLKTELSTVRGWIARELRKRGETIAVVSDRLFVKPGEVRKLLEVKRATRE